MCACARALVYRFYNVIYFRSTGAAAAEAVVQAAFILISFLKVQLDNISVLILVFANKLINVFNTVPAATVNWHVKLMRVSYSNTGRDAFYILILLHQVYFICV